MPRFANLKGSMNPFNNNKPVLSSSERLKNKRDKTIYQSQKQHFQSKRKCGNKNVKYYDNGTIRSTDSYKMNMKLSRGAALCQDCDGNGTLCENIFDKNDLTKITMGNNVISTLSLGTGLARGGEQINTANILIADISGVWGTKTKDEPYTYTPYGYATNLITVPRNLNGSGIIIDPVNVLFNQDDNCNSRTIPKPNYMNRAFVKTVIIYEGPIAAHENPVVPGQECDIIYPSDTVNTIVGSVKYFKHFLNQYCIFTFEPWTGLFDTDAVPTGQITKICPLGKKLMNSTYFGSTFVFEVDIFKLYVEISYMPKDTHLWQGSISPSADKTNDQPVFNPPSINFFKIQSAALVPTVPTFCIFSDWASNCISTCNHNGGGIEMKVTIDQNNTTLCNISQIRGNNTKQSYMSCLEDKTRKINFTKNTVKQQIITSPPQATIEILPSTTVISITSGPYTIFMFKNTAPGQTLNIQFKNNGWIQFEHLIVGGGGSGGPVDGASLCNYLSGGGGGGSIKNGIATLYGITNQITTIPITVGNGGPESNPFSPTNTTGHDGSGSSIEYPGSTITAVAGTAGFCTDSGVPDIYAKGGISGWSLLPPPLSQPFYEGADGTGCPDPPWVIYGHVAGGGGGGATGDGGVAGPGLVLIGSQTTKIGGKAYSVSADNWGIPNPTLFGGGGGGGGQEGGGPAEGGGGTGGSYFEGPPPVSYPPAVPLTLPMPGTTNSGGGGGGGTYSVFGSSVGDKQGAAGGSGIVIIRVKTALIN